MAVTTHNDTEKKVVVLYIEDDIANRQLIRLILSRKEGITFHEAETGKEGLKYINDFMPDIIFLDLGLPDLSGYELLKIIRDDMKMGSTPIIAVSGDNLPNDISRGLDAGFQGYLTKPINITRVFEIVDETIGSLS